MIAGKLFILVTVQADNQDESFIFHQLPARGMNQNHRVTQHDHFS